MGAKASFQLLSALLFFDFGTVDTVDQQNRRTVVSALRGILLSPRIFGARVRRFTDSDARSGRKEDLLDRAAEAKALGVPPGPQTERRRSSKGSEMLILMLACAFAVLEAFFPAFTR